MPKLAYPILLDITDRLCVIVGGGTVAVRKAKGLIEAGAQRVHMIAPMFSADIPTIVQQVRECYSAGHLEQADLAFAATNQPQVNDAVVRDARSRGIPVNRVDGDDELAGDFVTPARLDYGPVIATVSAGSAALSVMIRDRLASQWEPAWTALAEAMVELRPEIKSRWDEPTRRAIFRALATTEAMDVVTAGGIDALRDWMSCRFGAGT